MTRLSYEQELALGFDPTPGDPDAFVAGLVTLRQAGSALDEVARALRGATADTAWRGQAAVAFRSLVDEELRPRVETAAAAFGEALRVLEGWRFYLSNAQATTVRLGTEAARLVALLAAAQTSLDANSAPNPGSGASLGRSADVEYLTRTASLAAEDLAALRRTAVHHGADFEAEGEAAARRLQHALDAAPNEPGFWDRLGDMAGRALDGFQGLPAAMSDVALALLEPIAPALLFIGDLAGILSAVAGLLALVPGGQFLALPAVILGGTALLAHYGAAAGREGSLTAPLTNRDIATGLALDAVGVLAGAAALRTGTKVLAAARASGAPTRMVPQWIGAAEELPMGYFQLAQTSYAMSGTEMVWRRASYLANAAGGVATTAQTPEMTSNIESWTRLRLMTTPPGRAQ